jgi:DNA transformation protein
MIRAMAPKHARRNENIAHLLELFEPLGAVTARSLFGEHGFFLAGAMFALVYSDTLYLRVDDRSRPRHEARGLEQFVYVDRNGRSMPMPYFAPPSEALDDAQAMTEWARPAVEAALAAARAKRAPRKTKSAGARKPVATPAKSPRKAPRSR